MIIFWDGFQMRIQKRFKYNKDLWVLQSTYEYGGKHTDKYRDKRNFYTRVLINKFTKLTKLKIKNLFYTYSWLEILL